MSRQPSVMASPPATSAAPSASGDDTAVLDAVLTSLPAGVVVLDRSGRVARANPAALALLGADLPGSVWRDVIEQRFDLDAAADAVLLRDGRRVSVETCPLDGGSGQVLLMMDVSEAYELRQRVMRRERLSALGEVSASLAHQIRTPLAAALLYAGQLGAGRVADADRLRYAARIGECLGNIEALIRDMLLFVRGEVLGARALAVGDLLDRLPVALAAELEPREARLEVATDGAGLQVQGNQEVLCTVLHNLIVNSLQAGARLVRIEPQRLPDGQVGILIVDDGPGIAAELREQVFRPFFTTRAGGTGLGLAVARNVARAHRGDLQLLESGPGCRLLLSLPCAATAAGAALPAMEVS